MFMVNGMCGTMSESIRNKEGSFPIFSTPKKEGHMESNEDREHTMKKIQFYLPDLTDQQLRLVSGFIKGLKKG